jgi:AcrR family transcriptional regulator
MPANAPPTVSRTLTERRHLETQRAIADAAAALFAERGYENVTVEEIAREAGVSTRTLYRHCPTKDDVFVPVLTEGIDELVGALAARPATEDLATAVQASYDELVTESAEAARMVAVLMDAPPLRARWLDAMHDVEGLLVPVVEARASGAMSPLEARLTAGAIVLALRASLELSAGKKKPTLALDLSHALTHLRAGAGL